MATENTTQTRTDSETWSIQATLAVVVGAA